MVRRFLRCAKGWDLAWLPRPYPTNNSQTIIVGKMLYSHGHSEVLIW